MKFEISDFIERQTRNAALAATGLFLVVLCVAMAGCGSSTDERVSFRPFLIDSNKAKATEFIQETVRAANQHVDDPEQAITQATETALGIYGSMRVGIEIERNYTTWFVPYDQCSPRQKLLCDNFLKTGEQP